jgi:hypothetical protein
MSLSSILSPFRLHSIFLPASFPPSSHFATSIPHVLDYLSLLIAHSARSFLSFHPIPVFSLLVPTSESRHHFSLSCTLSPYTPCCILYLDSLILALISCLSMSLSLLLSSIFIHLLFALNLSTSSLAYPFFW